MILPDVQLRAEGFGASGIVIGLLQSSTFGVQLLISPAWWRLSDRVGRKPVLVGLTLVSALSMFAYAPNLGLWGILVSRVLAGLAGANVAVAQAYLADHSKPEQRATAMGRIGVAVTAGRGVAVAWTVG